MKAFKKLVIAVICAAFMMSSAAHVLADETTAASQPDQTASETEETFDISKMSFDTMYGNQVMDFLNHEYVFDGKKIPITESNYYFLLTFLQLSQYAAYGYYPATGEGYIDLAAKTDDGKTYAEFYVQQAEEYLESTYILAGRAKAAGLKLTDEDKKAIDDEINERIEQQAKPAGVPLDTILKLYFGPECDEKAYRAILENATYAGKYQQKYAKDYKIPDAQKMVPNITYALFYAPGASASEEDKKKAETAANELLKSCKNIEELKTKAEAAQQAGTVYDQGTLPVRKGEMVSSFEDWAYGEGRKEGEMGVIYAQEYGYFVVGYAGKVKLADEDLQEVANEALNAEIEAELKAKKHGFKTDKAYPTAKPAPTAVPEATESGTGLETVPSALPTDDGNTAKDNGMSKVLIVVFVVIGGIAIVAVIAILVMNYMNSGKEDTSSKKSSSKKSSAKKSEPAKKSSKKVVEEDDEDEDEEEEIEEEDYEDEEEEEPEEEEDLYSGLAGVDDEDEDDSKSGKKNNKKK